MKYIRRFPILFYFVASVLISYVVGIEAYILLRRAQIAIGVNVTPVNEVVLRFGPSCAGLLTIWLLAGRQRLRALLKRTVQWRAPLLTYVTAIALPPTITLAVFALRGYSAELHAGDGAAVLGVFGGQLALATVFGGLGEELGWRGFMLPRLSERHSGLVASLFVALAWFAWHIPAYVFTNKAASDPILPFAAIMLPFSIVLTWIYYRSRESLLLPILLHGSVNASYYTLEELFPAIVDSPSFQPAFDWMLAGIWGVVAVVVVGTDRRVARRRSWLDSTTTDG